MAVRLCENQGFYRRLSTANVPIDRSNIVESGTRTHSIIHIVEHMAAVYLFACNLCIDFQTKNSRTFFPIVVFSILLDLQFAFCFAFIRNKLSNVYELITKRLCARLTIVCACIPLDNRIVFTTLVCAMHMHIAHCTYTRA